MTMHFHWAWVILLASFVTVFTNYSVRFSYGILMPEMIVALGITKAQAGAIVSSFFISYTLFAPLLGYWIDRVSAPKLLAIFSFILGSGTFLMGKPTSLLQACLFFALTGVGSAAMWTPVMTLVQRWFTVRRRGMALGILSISYTVGYGIMGLVLPPLAARYDWRTCWVILSFLAFALVPLNGVLLRNKPRDLNLSPWGSEPGLFSENDSGESKGRVPYGELLRIKNLWRVAASYFFIAFTAYVVNTFIVTYGTMELKFPFAQAAHLASTLAFSGVAGALLLPILSDSLGRKKCLILINSCLTLAILLILWAGNHWVPLLFAVGIFGFFYAAIWPMYAAVAADLFTLGATGSVLGFWTIFYGLALILAPALGGYIADLTGSFVSSFLTGILTGCLATIFLLPIQKMGGEDQTRGT